MPVISVGVACSEILTAQWPRVLSQGVSPSMEPSDVSMYISLLSHQYRLDLKIMFQCNVSMYISLALSIQLRFKNHVPV